MRCSERSLVIEAFRNLRSGWGPSASVHEPSRAVNRDNRAFSSFSLRAQRHTLSLSPGDYVGDARIAVRCGCATRRYPGTRRRRRHHHHDDLRSCVEPLLEAPFREWVALRCRSCGKSARRGRHDGSRDTSRRGRPLSGARQPLAPRPATAESRPPHHRARTGPLGRRPAGEKWNITSAVKLTGRNLGNGRLLWTGSTYVPFRAQFRWKTFTM